MIEPQYAQTDVHGNELSDSERAWLETHSIDIDSFVKTNWKSADARDQWREYTNQFHDARTTAEWRSVLDDDTDRRAAIVHVNHQNRDTWLERVGEHDLHYRQIRYTTPYDGYRHEVVRADASNPERISYAVIAEDSDIADKMEEAENELGGVERHDTVGELLGFPECCRDFFADHFLGEGGRRDPMYEVACNSPSSTAIDGDPQNVRVDDPHPAVNPLYRYFGYAFVTHIPCSFECSDSIDIGMHRGEIIADQYSSELANRLWQWLDAPMVWEGHKAIAHVRNDWFIGSSNTSDYWSKKRVVVGEEHDGGSVVEDRDHAS